MDIKSKIIIKNNYILIFCLFIFILILILCISMLPPKTQKTNKNIIFDIKFNEYGTLQLGVLKNKIDIDTLIWKKHEQDSIVYFNVSLNNLNIKPFIIKTKLIASKIPFFIEYKKIKLNHRKDNYINLNIVHQFNTICTDSIILINDSKVQYPHIEKVFRVCYQKFGKNSTSKIPIHWNKDTLDLSNQK
jgi:hypothetical protein